MSRDSLFSSTPQCVKAPYSQQLDIVKHILLGTVPDTTEFLKILSSNRFLGESNVSLIFYFNNDNEVHLNTKKALAIKDTLNNSCEYFILLALIVSHDKGTINIGKSDSMVITNALAEMSNFWNGKTGRPYIDIDGLMNHNLTTLIDLKLQSYHDAHQDRLIDLRTFQEESIIYNRAGNKTKATVIARNQVNLTAGEKEPTFRKISDSFFSSRSSSTFSSDTRASSTSSHYSERYKSRYVLKSTRHRNVAQIESFVGELARFCLWEHLPTIAIAAGEGNKIASEYRKFTALEQPEAKNILLDEKQSGFTIADITAIDIFNMFIANDDPNHENIGIETSEDGSVRPMAIDWGVALAPLSAPYYFESGVPTVVRYFVATDWRNNNRYHLYEEGLEGISQLSDRYDFTGEDIECSPFINITNCRSRLNNGRYTPTTHSFHIENNIEDDFVSRVKKLCEQNPDEVIAAKNKTLLLLIISPSELINLIAEQRVLTDDLRHSLVDFMADRKRMLIQSATSTTHFNPFILENGQEIKNEFLIQVARILADSYGGNTETINTVISAIETQWNALYRDCEFLSGSRSSVVSNSFSFHQDTLDAGSWSEWDSIIHCIDEGTIPSNCSDPFMI